jgi:hypothetical protein
VARLYDSGKAEAGCKALQSLLEEHTRQPYAYARRVEVEDLARRLAFRRQVQVPEPESVVSGDLRKWDGSRGEITIVYTPNTAKDLETSERSGMRYFPMDVRGSFTLTVEGSSYPKTTKQSPTVYFGEYKRSQTDQDQSWVIMFGTPPYTEGANEVWMPAGIIRYDGDNKVKVVEKEITPARPGKSYTLVVRIQRTSISATINGKALGSTNKGKDVWGFLGFDVPGWERVTLSGTVEPAWLQGLLDAKVQAQREEFDKRYDPKSVLPAWLFEAPPPVTAAEPSTPQQDLPQELDRRHWPALARIYEDVVAERYPAAIEGVAEMRRDGAPEAVCCFLEARCRAELGEWAAALAGAERCCEMAPGYQGAHLLRAEALRQVGRESESTEAFLAALRISPRDADGYESAALSLLYVGDTEGAGSVLEMATANGVTSKPLASLSGALVKARNGPTWARTFEHKSLNYHVLSDIDKETCIQASKVLEEAFTHYRVHFGWVERVKGRLFKVYLFGGQAGFQQYQQDIQHLMGKPSEHAAGLYSPLLKQLLIWNLPNRDEMIVTVRHEGFHQYLDRFMPDPPVWFNEGLAVYHENAESRGGRLVFGVRQDSYVDLLREKGLFPLAEYLYWGPRRFYEVGTHAYAQGWALCHMLRHGKAEHKALFKQLVEAFQTAEGPTEILKRVFTPEVTARLAADLAAYVQNL